MNQYYPPRPVYGNKSSNSIRTNLQSTPARRALIAGAIIGGTAATAAQWQIYRQGGQSLEHAVLKVIGTTVKAGIISGTTMAIADATAARPVKTLLTLLGVGVASMYVLDSLKGRTNEKYETTE